MKIRNKEKGFYGEYITNKGNKVMFDESFVKTDCVWIDCRFFDVYTKETENKKYTLKIAELPKTYKYEMEEIDMENNNPIPELIAMKVSILDMEPTVKIETSEFYKAIRNIVTYENDDEIVVACSTIEGNVLVPVGEESINNVVFTKCINITGRNMSDYEGKHVLSVESSQKIVTFCGNIKHDSDYSKISVKLNTQNEDELVFNKKDMMMIGVKDDEYYFEHKNGTKQKLFAKHVQGIRIAMIQDLSVFPSDMTIKHKTRISKKTTKGITDKLIDNTFDWIKCI